MKILLIHNFYQSSSPSGEDMVFEAEKKLLELRGQKVGNWLKVISHEKYNDDINGFRFSRRATLPFKMIWSRETYKEVRNIIRKEKPDIAHFHNIFYLVSPSAYYACKTADVPVVQTLHNYRFFCVNGLLIKDGKICEKCVGKLPWRGAVNGCFRASRSYSVAIALMESLHRFLGTWVKEIDAYIALTEFGKKKFIECGLPAEKIFVKPNFLLNPPQPRFSHNGYAVFLGRLSEEKGLDILIDAVGILQSLPSEPLQLKIVGDGPLKKRLEERIRLRSLGNIEFIGRRNGSQSIELLKNAQFLIMPSVCYETFGLSVVEAFACGKAVIASNLGSMASLVEEGRTGLLFEPGNPEDLASKIVWMLENEDACVEMGRNARKVFEEKYTAEKNYEILMSIYRTVIENKKEGLYD